MKHLRLSVVIIAATLVLLTCSCGSSSSKHEIVSLSISPASVTSTGPVQFTATGQYKTPPYTEVPARVNWGACFDGAPTNDITVAQTGVAQCNQGVTGTYTIWANSPIDSGGPTCQAIGPCGIGCGMVTATAQLMCGTAQ